MMRILLLLLIAIGSIYSVDAQKKKDYRAQVEAIMWPANDPHSKTFDVPDKWSEESAVIIYQKIYYRYETLGKKMVKKNGIRRRIKLLDQSAVDDYSEFSVTNPYSSQKGNWAKFETSLVGMKIYKPDKSIKQVDLENAVTIEDKGNSEKQKIAIPNLEIGDILDFYYYAGDVDLNIGVHYFPYYNSTLSSSYSIMEQQFEFSIYKDFYFKIKSCNGAPALKLIPSTDKKFSTYLLTDKDRAKTKDIRWYAENKEEPHIKFQAMYSPIKKHTQGKPGIFWGDEGVLLTEIGTKELIKRYEEKSKIIYPNKYKFENLKIAGQEEEDLRKRLEFHYNKQRYDRVMQYLEPITLIQENIKSDIYGLAFNGFPNSWDMVQHMAAVCKKLNIDHKVIVTTPRENAVINDLFLESELEYLLSVEINGVEIYFTNWYLFSEFDQVANVYEGTEGLSFSIDDDGNFTKGTIINFPTSTYKENLTARKIELDLSDLTKEEFRTKRMSLVTGHSKDYYQSNLFIQVDFLEHEYNYHEEYSYLGGRVTGTVKSIEDARKRYKEYTEKEREKQQETAEDILKNDVSFEIKKYEKFDPLATGRYDQPTLKYTDDFTIDKSFLKKAGKNYIIPVGSLVGDQVAIKEKELERSADIYMSFARSFKNDIVVTLPEGAIVKGLDKLTFDVQNATGGFTSTAKLEGNVLTMKTHKWYEHNFEEVADWQKMVDFLEAAFQFSQQKVLVELN